MAAALCLSGALGGASAEEHVQGTGQPPGALDGELESLRRDFSIAVLPGPLVTPDLLGDIRAGIQAVPPGARRFPGGTLEIELHAGASPFGMGDGSPARPEWTGEHRRLHLYAYREPDEPRALFRLEKLDAEQRRHLWRARAVVHAIIRRWDDQLSWSRRAEWKRVTGWQFPLDRPLVFSEHPTNSYPWAYSRLRGMDSAALDLATFAEEALVPVESVLPGALAVDDTVRCQEFSKLRYLAERLRRLDPTVHPLLGDARCPAFEQWADLASFDFAEVLFSAPSGAQVESLFGHLLLRVVRRNVPGRDPTADTAIEIAALVGPREPLAQFLAKGVSGGFSTVIRATPLLDVLRRNVELDRRSIRRYRLRLSGDEPLRLMERIWELERRGYFPYYFLTDNCASMLVFLLNGALDEARQISLPGPPWALPADALDRISSVTVEEVRPSGVKVRAPLLERLDEDFSSHMELAREAERNRDALLDQLTRIAPSDVATIWASARTELTSRKLAERVAAYRKLPDLVQQTLDGTGPERPETRARLSALLRALWTIERYVAGRAESSAERIHRSSRLVPADLPLPSTQELVTQRQHLFQREMDPQARAEKERTRGLELETRLQSLPSRALTDDERRTVQEAGPKRDAFLELMGVVGDIVDRSLGGEPEAMSHAAAGDEARSPGGRRSGSNRLAFGMAVRRDPEGGVGVAAMLRAALLSERLGEHRSNGLGERTEARVLDATAYWSTRAGLPELEGLEVTALRSRMLNLEPAVARNGLLDELGWGGALEWALERTSGYEALAHVEGYALLQSSPSFDTFTLLGLGPAMSIDAAWAQEASLLGGPRIELAHRQAFADHMEDALRLELSYAPQFGLEPRPGLVQHDIRIAAEMEKVIPITCGMAVSLTLGVAAHVQLRGDRSAENRLQGFLAIESR